jgi:hypothetical protein
MRRKLAWATVLTVCFALVAIPAMSAERSTRSGRGSATEVGEAAENASGANHVEESIARPMGVRFRIAPANLTDKAQMLLGTASGQQGTGAIATLNEILGLGLQSTPENDKILGEVNRRLGELYQSTPRKAVHHYGVALQYTSDPGQRAELENRIHAAGGDVFDIAFNNANTASSTPRTIGVADSCDTANAITIPFDSGYTLNIDNASFPGFVDADWYTFDVTGTQGVFLTIETLTDEPGNFVDDTDLTLWTGCTAGFPDTQLGFDDDSGVDFMSLLSTGCLGPGTYYLEVGGWQDDPVFGNPNNFALVITQTGTCEVPLPDNYEPDNVPVDASNIGWHTSFWNRFDIFGWFRPFKENQKHSIVPAGDEDWMEFWMWNTELVRMGTAITFPTYWNHNESVPAGLDNDTYLELFYGTPPYYGGLCNDGIFGTFCVTDADCGAPVIPGYPPCIPYDNFNGVPTSFYSGALAANDDVGGGVFGSELLLCLPPESAISPFGDLEADDYLVRVTPFSASDQFNYEARVRLESKCKFNKEPNSDFETAKKIKLGDAWHGIFDYAVFQQAGPSQGIDPDLFKFDVESDKSVRVETSGYDQFLVDTFVELFVGPDDLGNFYYTGVSNEDGGPGWWSLFTVIVPPANDLLGNVTANADYYLNVTSHYLNPNFPYTLLTTASEPPSVEAEPNNTNATANSVSLGETVSAQISPACDFDVFSLTISGDNYFVEMDILGGFDTVVQLVDCGTSAVIACDDDSGEGFASSIDACLGPGTYCIKVRPWSTSSTGAYDLQISAGEAGCASPGTGTGDNGTRCTTGFDTCP